MELRKAFVPVLGLLLLAASSAPARIWTDSTGKFSVDAELLEVEGGKVVLKKPTGEVFNVPVGRLSKADQEYLQSLARPGAKSPGDRAAAQPATVPRDEKLAAELKTGSIVSIHAVEQPVHSVLAQIEKATGNPVRIVDEFGQNDDEQILSKSISLDLQEMPFWETVDALAAAAGVQFHAIDDGTLKLSTKRPQADEIRAVGPSTIVGAFQVQPGIDDLSGDAMIVVRLEPRFGEPQVRGYQAAITLPDGKQIQYKPQSIFGTDNIFTGELTLRFKPDLPDGTSKARELKLEAGLAIASDWEAFTLPPLGELAPKPVAVGDGLVYVTQAELISKPSDREVFVVALLAEGLSFNLKNIVLVDMTGNRLKSRGRGGGKVNNKQIVQLVFTRATISGDPGKCRLALEVPGAGEKTIGPLEDLVAKSTPAGATILRITSSDTAKKRDGTEYFRVIALFDGFPAWRDGATLVGISGQVDCHDCLRDHQFSTYDATTPCGGKTVHFYFKPAQIRGKEDSHCLRLQVPTKVTEHVLLSTFSDVPLAKEG